MQCTLLPYAAPRLPNCANWRSAGTHRMLYGFPSQVQYGGGVVIDGIPLCCSLFLLERDACRRWFVLIVPEGPVHVIRIFIVRA